MFHCPKLRLIVALSSLSCFSHCNFCFCHHCEIAGWLLNGYDVVCTTPLSLHSNHPPIGWLLCISCPSNHRRTEDELDSRVWGRWAPTPPGACRIMASPAKLRNSTISVTIVWAEMAEIEADYMYFSHRIIAWYNIFRGVMGVRFDGETALEVMNVVYFLHSLIAVMQIWWEERQWRCLWQNRRRQWMSTKSVVEGEELSHVFAGVWRHREWQQPMVNVII